MLAYTFLEVGLYSKQGLFSGSDMPQRQVWNMLQRLPVQHQLQLLQVKIEGGLFPPKNAERSSKTLADDLAQGTHDQVSVRQLGLKEQF